MHYLTDGIGETRHLPKDLMVQKDSQSVEHICGNVSVNQTSGGDAMGRHQLWYYLSSAKRGHSDYWFY